MEPVTEKVSNTPTVERLLKQNNELIQYCLKGANRLYSVLTTDNYLKENDKATPSCIITDLMIQNDNLIKLNQIISLINENIFEGGE